MHRAFKNEHKVEHRTIFNTLAKLAIAEGFELRILSFRRLTAELFASVIFK